MNQTTFRQALLNPDLPVPQGLVDSQGRPAGRRFSVYRNNVAGSLTEVLEQGFPVLKKLLGDDFFTVMASVFLRESPPTSRIMMLYGDKMSHFLQRFPPVSQLPYLPDIARLEQSMRESYHAADANPIDPQKLAELAPDAFMAARLQLAPALRVLRSDWPILSIWKTNMEDAPQPKMRAEDVIILRPEFDPEMHLLPAGGATFVTALQQGQTVGEAISACGPELDLQAVLTLLITGNAIVGLKEDPA